jgi:hypothetical protein
MNRHLLHIATLIFFTTLIGCSRTTELNENLLETYSNYVVLRNTPGDSSESKHRLDSLLFAKGYTRETFFTELRAMGSDPDRMRVFYDSVRARIARMDSAKARYTP